MSWSFYVCCSTPFFHHTLSTPHLTSIRSKQDKAQMPNQEEKMIFNLIWEALSRNPSVLHVSKILFGWSSVPFHLPLSDSHTPNGNFQTRRKIKSRMRKGWFLSCVWGEIDWNDPGLPCAWYDSSVSQLHRCRFRNLPDLRASAQTGVCASYNVVCHSITWK